MTLLSRLADRLVLQPTTNPIDTENRERKWIETPSGKIEIWICRSPAETSTQTTPLLMLKFPGTGGRAERARNFPAHLWPNFETEVLSLIHI